jgi:hypothetical protein
MLRRLTRSLLLIPTLLAASLVLVSVSLAHDHWISRGGLKNTAGEWCCGAGDCFVVPSEAVHLNGVGYELVGGELVPYNEAQPSPDGAFWRCKRPDGSRRCFFAPPPSM